jgi:hypothetical protein
MSWPGAASEEDHGEYQLRRRRSAGLSYCAVTYTTVEARQKVLADMAIAAEQIAIALTALGQAYEQLDEQRADLLEAQLFRPVQQAYGRVQRTYADFAARSGLPGRTFQPPNPGTLSQTIQTLIDRAVLASGEGDQTVADLQDSMLPVEVGDPELRAGLASVREALAAVPIRARALTRGVGR